LKLVYDNIHGYIQLNETEAAIVDTPLFRRLQRISHLGLAPSVYPGATHTRFAHSLGTLYVMDRVVSQLVSEGVCIEDRQALRLAALLHDVGHYPFSHALEMPTKKDYAVEGRDMASLREVGHESIGRRLIREDPDISGLVNKVSNVDKVVSILAKSDIDRPLYSYLMSSSMDVDRIDYLQRDSAYSGAAYGRIDADRLISTMTVDNILRPNYLAIHEKGKQAVENFLIGRYHMFQALYYHRSVCALEFMLRNVCSSLIKDRALPSWEELKDSLSRRFIDYDDSYVWQEIKKARKKEGIVGQFAQMLLNGVQLELAYEFSELSKEESEVTEEKLAELREKISRKSNVDMDSVFCIKTSDIDFIGDDPEETVYIESEGECYPILDNKQSIIYHLWDSKYRTIRVYAKNEEYAGKIGPICKPLVDELINKK
jgi:HD superfamily phosphohydrolase